MKDDVVIVLFSCRCEGNCRGGCELWTKIRGSWDSHKVDFKKQAPALRHGLPVTIEYRSKINSESEQKPIFPRDIRGLADHVWPAHSKWHSIRQLQDALLSLMWESHTVWIGLPPLVMIHNVRQIASLICHPSPQVTWISQCRILCSRKSFSCWHLRENGRQARTLVVS